MSTNERPTKRSVSAQIGHVCMVDRVAFSLLSLNEQSACVEELRAFVRTIPAYLEAEAEDSVIPLDTGDGVVLVFLGDPQLAGEAALALRDYSQSETVKLRIGLSSGPVTLRTDLAGKPNASGPGIDLAQRVMSVAEPSTVMISRSMADNLLAFDAWRPLIHEAGSFTVKHEQEIFLYRFQSGGDASVPEPPAPVAKAILERREGVSLSRKQVTMIGSAFAVLVIVLIVGFVRLQSARANEAAATPREAKLDKIAALMKTGRADPPVPPKPPAKLSPAEKKKVSVNYRGTNIRIALRQLLMGVGAQFNIDAGVSGVVTLKQENAPLGEVLKNALAQVGATYVVENGRFHVSMAAESSEDYLDPYGFWDEEPS